MSIILLPKTIELTKAPPIKCQGIKTKLVPFIAEQIEWNGEGRWIEPFLGSGVLLFNIQPQRALISDTNIYIINIYKEIQSGVLTGEVVRDYLESEGTNLRESGETHYKFVRQRFNESPTSLDFIFLNRSCFNGLIRFNSKGGFNVPFGKKPNRFSKAYITKIVNQVNWVAEVMRGKDWTFEVCNWKETLDKANTDDFVYIDPPYLGRNADYFNTWGEQHAYELVTFLENSTLNIAYSMWYQNKYRKNPEFEQHWLGDQFDIKFREHFYHIGAKEELRNAMKEALVIKYVK